MRLYEQSLQECEAIPVNAHSVSARLQLLTNLEAQLVQSSANIQQMVMKADVLAVVQSDSQAEAEVIKAKAKLEAVRQQLETSRLVFFK